MVVDGTTLAAILGRLLRPAPPRPTRCRVLRRSPRASTTCSNSWARGSIPHAIARELGISLNTCRGYQKSILAKLGAHSQLEAVVIASRRGVIGSDLARNARPSVAGQRGRN